jgi:hypothetical protein
MTTTFETIQMILAAAIGGAALIGVIWTFGQLIRNIWKNRKM